jgi:hypothetical protein
MFNPFLNDFENRLKFFHQPGYVPQPRDFQILKVFTVANSGDEEKYGSNLLLTDISSKSLHVSTRAGFS